MPALVGVAKRAPERRSGKGYQSPLRWRRGNDWLCADGSSQDIPVRRNILAVHTTETARQALRIRRWKRDWIHKAEADSDNHTACRGPCSIRRVADRAERLFTMLQIGRAHV